MQPRDLWWTIAILVASTAQALGEDDLFSQPMEDGLVSQAQETERSIADDLLTSEGGVTISGDFAFTLETRYDDVIEEVERDAAIGGTLNIEARPNADQRVLAKLDYELNRDGEFDATLREWFGDVSVEDTVFIRAGRQTLSWGVGYFYSPADVVNTQDIDPLDPEADRTGVLSIRAHRPIGTSNYYAYLLPTEEGNDLAIKGEWRAGKTELGLGLVVQDEGADTLMTTLARPWGNVDWFAEGALTYDSPYHDFTDTGLGEARNDRVMAQATVGAKATLSEDDDYRISLTAQTYYNGLGYDEAYWQTQPQAWQQALAAGRVSTDNPGRFYSAASIRWQEILQSDFSASMTALANHTDGSWLVQPRVGYQLKDVVEVAVETRHDRGDTLGTYSRNGDQNQIKVTLTVADIGF